MELQHRAEDPIHGAIACGRRLSVIAVLAVATLVFTLAMDFIKLAVFARVQVD